MNLQSSLAFYIEQRNAEILFDKRNRFCDCETKSLKICLLFELCLFAFDKFTLSLPKLFGMLTFLISVFSSFLWEIISNSLRDLWSQLFWHKWINIKKFSHLDINFTSFVYDNCWWFLLLLHMFSGSFVSVCLPQNGSWLRCQAIKNISHFYYHHFRSRD